MESNRKPVVESQTNSGVKKNGSSNRRTKALRELNQYVGANIKPGKRY